MSDDDSQAAKARRTEPPPRTDLDLGLQFVHLLGMQTRFDNVQALGAIYALIEELTAKGVLDLRSFEERRQRAMRREAERAADAATVEMADAPDKYALGELPKIDCEALIPLCKARCCTMSVTLSRQDLDERVVRWEYARPYRIRRREDSYCAHNDAQTHRCEVYENRPAPCRTYDCRQDKRIWLDFEKRIPAPVEEGQ